MLRAQERVESGGRDLTNPKSGAAGYMQFLPDTAKQFGVEVHNEASSIQGAAKYLHQMELRFEGDLRKAVAGYNWGPENVAKVSAKYGADWERHLPAETSAYLQKIFAP